MTSDTVAVDTTAVTAVVDPPSTSPTSPRKRRRRAPTTGAADDCFACQESHTACDRRRPYCTQCIDRGKTCSGYKTTLTWGVGVASRGKLRGLSLPVAKSKKENAASKESSKKSAKGTAEKPQAAKCISTSETEKTTASSMSSSDPPVNPITKTTFDFVSVDPNASAQASVAHTSNFQWAPHPPIMQTSHVRNQEGPPPKKARRFSLQPLAVPPTMSPQEYSSAPMSANILGSYQDSSYANAMQPSPPTPLYQSSNGSTPVQKSFPHVQAWSGGHVPRSQPSIPSWPPEPAVSLISDHGSQYQSESPDSTNAPTFMSAPGTELFPIVHPFECSVKTEPTDDTDEVEEIYPEQGQLDFTAKALMLQFPYGVSNNLVGSTKSLRELIHYYDQVISPVIVAFDSPSNPYRTHILRLASGSDALQHAIAALSASNLRMRKDYEQVTSAKRIAPADFNNDTPHDATVRKSSLAHNLLRDSIAEPENSVPGQPSQRELFHKGESIKALNASLGDAARRHDDSILATLLVLCLYHICDTGIAKFRTQFAGVKKILALRNRRSTSQESKWLIKMFRWFDAMTATVNDREGQFDEDDGLGFFESEEWSLENLVGCDSRLFNIVSRLGRLNLLSQGKPVSSASLQRPLAPRSGNPNFYSVTGSNLDGWTPPQQYQQQTPDPRNRNLFWPEWNSIRQELHDWEFDPSSLPTVMLSSDPLSTNISIDINTGMDVSVLDLKNVSETFRYAALLYTERLGNPTAPSSAANFQSLVSQAIPFLSAVKSDVCLLWPLFITGTECVDPDHRELIRKRCLSIQQDSGFFNNTSVLRILEELWETNESDGNIPIVPAQSGSKASKKRSSSDDDTVTPGVFRWRKAMMSSALDAEYIVI